jgi:hypothetical protein
MKYKNIDKEFPAEGSYKEFELMKPEITKLLQKTNGHIKVSDMSKIREKLKRKMKLKK